MVWIVAAALAAGILQSLWFLLLVVLFIPYFVYRAGDTPRVALSLLLVAVAFFGYGYRALQVQQERMAHFKRSAETRGSTVVLDGWVSSFPQSSMGRTSFEFTTELDGVHLAGLVRCREFTIGYGDSLRLRASLGPSKRSRRSYDSYLRGRGLAGLIRVPPGGVERLGGSAGNVVVARVLWPAHDRLRQVVHRGVGSRAGVPLALLLGERGAIDRRINQVFRSLGITHLLALSGLHLGFVAAFLLVILRVLGRGRGIALAAGLGLYVAVVGTILSLYRSFVMAVILITAHAYHRPLRPMTALADAFVVVLLLHPYAFYAVGFQLSFLATFAVLLAVRGAAPSREVGVGRRILGYATSTIRVSVAVQVVMAPLLLHYFGKLSVVAPLATLAFVFPVAALLFSTFAAAVVGVVAPSVGPYVFGLLTWMARWLEASVLAVSTWSPDPLELPTPDPVTYYAGIAVLAGLGKRWMGRVAGVALLAIAFVPNRIAAGISQVLSIVFGG